MRARSAPLRGRYYQKYSTTVVKTSELLPQHQSTCAARGLRITIQNSTSSLSSLPSGNLYDSLGDPKSLKKVGAGDCRHAGRPRDGGAKAALTQILFFMCSQLVTMQQDRHHCTVLNFSNFQ